MYDSLQLFLFILMRDHLPLGVVEQIKVEHVQKMRDGKMTFSNSNNPLDDYISELARYLTADLAECLAPMEK